MTQRSIGDFACIIAIEKAQYLAPEKGAEVKESSAQGTAKADFVKTATGFFGSATPEDVSLMRGVVGDRAGVKASGGIRTAANATTMIEAGANRLGASAGVAIVRELGAPEFTSRSKT